MWDQRFVTALLLLKSTDTLFSNHVLYHMEIYRK